MSLLMTYSANALPSISFATALPDVTDGLGTVIFFEKDLLLGLIRPSDFKGKNGDCSSSKGSCLEWEGGLLWGKAAELTQAIG